MQTRAQKLSQSLRRGLFLLVLCISPVLAEDERFLELGLKLARDVGGRWEVTTHSEWSYLSPRELPPPLEKGTYCIFLAKPDQDALSQALGWMEICAAPFYILGTNTDCVAVTYVPREHAVSQAIVHALDLTGSGH